MAARGLGDRSRTLDLEQAVHGVDSLDELALHALLREAWSGAGLGALAEQRYPAVSSRPRRSEGERCDVVLTHEPTTGLVDPLLSGTLFADDGADPGEALWIEVKVAAQHALVDGVAGPNPRYASQWLTGAVRDARRLTREPGVRHAAVCVVAFVEDERVLVHDAEAFAHRCLDRGLPIRAPMNKAFPIADRSGTPWARW